MKTSTCPKCHRSFSHRKAHLLAPHVAKCRGMGREGARYGDARWSLPTLRTPNWTPEDTSVAVDLSELPDVPVQENPPETEKSP